MRLPNFLDPEQCQDYLVYLLSKAEQNREAQQRNAWVQAARCGDLSQVQALIASVDDINGIGEQGETALGAAAGNGHLEVVQWLAGQGARLDAVGEERMSPLMLACLFDHREISLWFIGQGANIHVQNRQGMTPLHYAAETGAIEVVRSLLQRGANPDGKSLFDVGAAWKPLQSSVRFGRLEVARLLRQAGAVWPEDTPDGSTLLHLAARSRNPRMAQWLLAEGHNELESTNDEGQTPADIAGWNEDEDMRRYLVWRRNRTA